MGDVGPAGTGVSLGRVAGFSEGTSRGEGVTCSRLGRPMSATAEPVFLAGETGGRSLLIHSSLIHERECPESRREPHAGERDVV